MKKKLLTILFGIGFISLFAQPGALDATYTGNGFDGGAVTQALLQPDGKILAIGTFTHHNSNARKYIARVNSNGSTDNSFNVGTGFIYSVYALALQSDGKVLAGGAFAAYNGTLREKIARLNSNGSLDTSFHIGTGFGDEVLGLIVQPDGKIVVSGRFSSYNGTPCNKLTRLNSDGSIDTAFNIGSGPNSNVIYTCVLQPGGKIIVAGPFSSFNGISRRGIARLNADGSVDNTFDLGSDFSFGVTDIQFESSGKIVMSGNVDTINGHIRKGVLRLNANLSLDTGFNASDAPSIDKLAIQTDGKIIAGGNFQYFNGIPRFTLVRLNTDGSVDGTFRPQLGSLNGKPTSILIQPDGKLLVSGDYVNNLSGGRNRMFRLNGGAGSLNCSAQFTMYPHPDTPNLWYAVRQTSGVSPVTYQWVWGDGGVDSDPYPVHEYLNPGYYNICLTVFDGPGCYDTYCDSSTYIFKQEGNPITVRAVSQAPTGINEIKNVPLNIFPNPATNQLNINLGGLQVEQVNIYNVDGKLVSQTNQPANKSIDISSLAKGIYVAEVATTSKPHKGGLNTNTTRIRWVKM